MPVNDGMIFGLRIAPKPTGDVFKFRVIQSMGI
jgi:hypothetical protein